MPQMKPLFWLILSLFFITTLTLLLTQSHFIKKLTPPKNTYLEPLQPKSNPWKW